MAEEGKSGGLELAKAYIQVVPTTKDFGQSLQKAIGNDAEEAGKKAGNSLASGLKSVVGTIAKVASEAIAAGTAAAAAVAKKALDEQANYEQLVGGVETLFGTSGKSLEEYAEAAGKSVEEVRSKYYELVEAQEAVKETALSAYKDVGLSANEYMETVTSFAASLNASLGGDTMAAAEYARIAVTDMADNANKMGSSMESIQNAYQGFAKQNYTMLDNLKLGYGGTASEMLRLVKDAGVVSDSVSSINDVSFAQIVDAIHIIQDNMGITETTAQEAATTISGSIAMTESAYKNLLSAMADPDRMLGPYITDMWDSIAVVISNVEPVVETIVSRMPEAVETVGAAIVSYFPGMIEVLLPALVDSSIALVNSLVALLPAILEPLIGAIPTIVDALMTIIPQVIAALMEAVPLLIEAVVAALQQIVTNISDSSGLFTGSTMEIITQIIGAIIAAVPQLVEAGVTLLTAIIGDLPGIIEKIVGALPEIIDSIVTAILDNLPLLVESGVTLLTALVEALPEIIETIVEVLPEIIDSIINALLGLLPEIVQAGITLLTALITDLPTIILTIIDAIPEIISGIVNALVGNIDKIIMAGVELFVSLIENLPTIIVEIVKAVPQIIAGIVEAFDSLMYEIVEIGGNIVKGLWDGITQLASWLWDMVSGWISSIWDGICDFFGIHSPSKEMAWVGEMLVKGLSGSIEDNGDEAVKAAEGMAEGVMSQTQDVISALDDMAGAALDEVDPDLGVNAALGVSTSTEATTQLATLCALVEEMGQRLDNLQVVLDSGELVGGIASKVDQTIGGYALNTQRGVAYT